MGQQLPKTPDPPKKDLPAPFKGGDRVLDRRDIVNVTNEGPWPHPDPQHRQRGISLREERDRFSSTKEYKRQTRNMIMRPPRMPVSYKAMTEGLANDKKGQLRIGKKLWDPGDDGKDRYRSSKKDQ